MSIGPASSVDVGDGGDLSPTVSSGGNSSYWKQHLYILQEQAPKPRQVACATPTSPLSPRRPLYYGKEFHGMISRPAADGLLGEKGEGAYLVRESNRCPGTYTLCMRFDGRTLNYKLYFDGRHFVGEKRFDNIEHLVAEGLICMFMDKHAADYIRRMTDEAVYEQSPYSQCVPPFLRQSL